MDLYFFPDLIHDFFVDFNFGILLLFLFIIIFYIAVSWFLSDMNQLMYGKKTIIAWIPIANMYLLGELVFSKPVGYVLSGGFVLSLLLNTFVEYNLLISILTSLYNFALIGIAGYGIYKYIDLRKSAKNSKMVTNTLDLTGNNNDIFSSTTNGPTESMINNINVVPTNDISNINSVSLQNTSISQDNNLNVNNVNLIQNQNIDISNKINNIGLLNSDMIKPIGNNSTQIVDNSNVSSAENTTLKSIEEKHYEMPKLILEASEGKNEQKNNINVVSKDNKGDNKIDPQIEAEKMNFITGVEDDERMNFVTGDKIINSSSTNDNLIPKEEKITVVNGVISSSNDIKNEEEEKMNIVNGTIVSNPNINNQIVDNDSILDLNKKL